MADTPDVRYKVTMRNVFALPDGSIATHEATDYVAEDHLDTYTTDARTRWQAVLVSDEPDHGPAGSDGAYDVVAATTAPEGA